MKEQHLYKVRVQDCLRLRICGGEGAALPHALVLKKEIAAASEGAGLLTKQEKQTGNWRSHLINDAISDALM